MGISFQNRLPKWECCVLSYPNCYRWLSHITHTKDMEMNCHSYWQVVGTWCLCTLKFHLRSNSWVPFIPMYLSCPTLYTSFFFFLKGYCGSYMAGYQQNSSSSMCPALDSNCKSNIVMMNVT